MMSRFFPFAVGIFFVSLIVRLIHLFQIRRAPFFTLLMGDAQSYHAWAQRIAAGDWIGTDVFYQAPLYPYFLGIVYAVAGRSLLVVRVVQAIVGSAACVLVALAVWRLFSTRAALVAGLAMAIYAPAMVRLQDRIDVHAFAHITGGGIPGNLARVLPPDCDAKVRRDRRVEPRIFAEIQAAGDVSDDEMEHVFNLGVGMCAVVAADHALHALDAIREAGHDAWIVGDIVDGHGRVHIERVS